MAKRKRKNKTAQPRTVVVRPRFGRNFAAGETSRLTAGWTTQPLTSDETLERRLRPLRARSRELAENNDYMVRFLSMLTGNVIGSSGIRLQARPVGGDGRIDRQAAKAIEQTWTEWCKRGKCEVSGQLSWWEVENLFLTTVAVDGEALAVLHTRGPYDLQVQLVDPELLPVDYHNANLGNGNFIRMGVEFDSSLAPVNYHFLSVDRTSGSYTYRGQTYTVIPAARVIHGFLRKRVDQKRGYPWAANAMQRLHMLDGYEEAALINARVGASKMGFFSPDGGPYEGDDTDGDGNKITDAEPGSFEQLPMGMKFTPFNPDYPTGEFDSFTKKILRGISSGLNASYNLLANDLEGVNFSSIRTAVIEERIVWKGLQRWTSGALHSRVYDVWIALQLLAARIKVKGGALGINNLAKFSNVAWQGRGWAWVDPQKDVKSNMDMVSANMKSLSSVIRELGNDPDEVFEEIAAEKEKLKELGLSAAQVMGSIDDTGKGEEDDEDEAEDDEN